MLGSIGTVDTSNKGPIIEFSKVVMSTCRHRSSFQLLTWSVGRSGLGDCNCASRVFLEWDASNCEYPIIQGPTTLFGDTSLAYEVSSYSRFTVKQQARKWVGSRWRR
jgi:hypothetical protein